MKAKSKLRTCRATISCHGARADARWTTTCRCPAGPAIMTKVVTDVMAEKKNKEFVPVGIKLRVAERLERYLDEMAPVDK